MDPAMRLAGLRRTRTDLSQYVQFLEHRIEQNLPLDLFSVNLELVIAIERIEAALALVEAQLREVQNESP